MSSKIISLYISLLLTTLATLSNFSIETTAAAANNATVEEPEIGEWEYEPRIWTVEDNSDKHIDIDDSSYDIVDENFDTQPSFSDSITDDDDDNYDPHKEHYYLGPEVVLKQQQANNKECNQFRVDIQEAVVCDKKRCDKFDFEWPRYKNQLTLVSTTKHGMRFHRQDFAFARNRSEMGARTMDEDRVKFDLLELFKPKPTSTTTTTTTTTTASSQEDTTTTTAATTTTTSGDSDSDSETTATETNTETNTEPMTTTTTPENATSPTGDDRNVAVNGLPDGPRLISTIRLDTRRTRQTILGFGGALSDSSCRNIKSLSPEMSKSLMEDYFGDRGLRYNIVRMTIGSSDFSTTPYTNNDRKNGTTNKRRKDTRYAMDPNDDVEMNNFHLTEEDYEFKLPIARQAIATSKQEVKFFASLWSPPIWMKNNTNMIHGSLKGDIYGPYYRAMAELMIKWLEAYRKNGLEFWGITGQNEPITGVQPFIRHNSLGITKEDYILFYKLYFGPMMRRRGFRDTKIMILDDNKGYIPFWAKSFLEDKEAAKYIDGVAIHWYMNDDFENLNYLSKHHPDKFILSTEACNGYHPTQVHVLPGDWNRGVAYMLDIIKLIQKNSVGWVDWNMVLDISGGPSWAKNYVDAPVLVNADRDEYYKSPMFYAMGHFSRFVERNSVRLDHRLANARYDYPLETVAFKTPSNYIVIVALNANKHPVPLRVIVDKQLVRIVTLKADSFSTIVFKSPSNN